MNEELTIIDQLDLIEVQLDDELMEFRQRINNIQIIIEELKRLTFELQALNLTK